MRYLVTILVALTAAFTLSSVRSPTIGRIVPLDVNAALNLGPEGGGPGVAPAAFSGCYVLRDNCGSVTPSGFSVFIADGARNTADGTLFFVDVPSGSDGIFQLDPATCEIVSGTYYTVNSGTSQRGIAYDPELHHIYAGGWNDSYMNQHEADPPYMVIEYNYTGLAIASAAIDDANDYLFLGVNASPDMLHCYDISNGQLGPWLGSWEVPWQSDYYQFDMAGMSFDDDNGQLIMVNQHNSPYDLEAFDFNLSDGLVPAGYCQLSATDRAWGVALVEDGDPAPNTSSTYHPDIDGHEPPFEIDVYGLPDVYPPTDLACTVTEDADVELAWTGNDDYTAVLVYRDGEIIAVLDGEAVYYLDVAPPAGFHTYAVSGVIGEDESEQAFCEVIVYPADQQVCFDFNDTGGGWTAGGYADWQWGDPSYVFEGNAWETNLGTRYFNNSCGWLDSPPLRLGPTGGWVQFDAYNSVQCNQDGWNVQLSTDGGDTWSVIDPVEGYDQGVPYGACDQGLGGDTNCGFGQIEHWNLDLSAFAGTRIRIRFLFQSDSTVAYAGMILDNVCFDGVVTAPPHHRVPVSWY